MPPENHSLADSLSMSSKVRPSKIYRALHLSLHPRITQILFLCLALWFSHSSSTRTRLSGSASTESSSWVSGDYPLDVSKLLS